MKTIDDTTRGNQILNESMEKLIDRYSPDRIICFGRRVMSSLYKGVFMPGCKIKQYHYFLLMVVDEEGNIAHEVQEYMDSSFMDGKITILVYHKEAVASFLQKGSFFFCKTMEEGQLLYSKRGLVINDVIPLDSSSKSDQQLHAMKRFMYRYPMAEAFQDSAIECYQEEKYGASVFLFHQAIEHSCKALLNVYLDLRPDIHHLGWLIDLTVCFVDELNAIFPRETEEERRLFSVLQNSYFQMRYDDEFEVSKLDATQVYNQANEFMYVVKNLCRLKMPVLKLEEELSEEEETGD
ncbi:HEPN domain-containing protein [Pedobacter sp. AW31-3R]|uniref:HEPN domain-containing protein n=1 Tax=Pedobacter sp. AW31-3R TaxID=3445781 RepID=UPI003F9F835D